MSLVLLLSVISSAPCPALELNQRVSPAVVTVPGYQSSPDAPLEALRNSLKKRVSLVSGPDPVRTETGWVDRHARFVRAKEGLAQAKMLYRDLDSGAALNQLAAIMPDLAASQSEGNAIDLLAEAHLLAATILNASGRLDAARARLARTLFLKPKISVDPAQYPPDLVAELEAMRKELANPPSGALKATYALPPGTRLYVDGHLQEDGHQPGVWEVPAGRHLVRFVAPQRFSYERSVRVNARAITDVPAYLARDHELEDLGHLASLLRNPSTREKALATVAKRAGATTAVVGVMEPSIRREPNGLPLQALTLYAPSRPPVYLPDLSSAELDNGVEALLTCQDRPMPGVASAYLGTTDPLYRAEVIKSTPFYRRPWFWAITGAAVVAGAAVAVAFENTPELPDSFQATIVPRP